MSEMRETVSEKNVFDVHFIQSSKQQRGAASQSHRIDINSRTCFLDLQKG